MNTRLKQVLIFIGSFLVALIMNVFILIAGFSQFFLSDFNHPADVFIILFIVLLVWLLFIIPGGVSYYLAFKFYRKKAVEQGWEVITKKKALIITLVLTSLFGVLAFLFLAFDTQPRFEPYTFHEILPGEISETSLMPAPFVLVTPGIVFPYPSLPINTPTLSPRTTPSATITPTLVPTRTPNPPIMEISYPSEMQNIEMNASQTLCVVDLHLAGDCSSCQRRRSINDQTWSNYTDIFTLCLDPQEGLNRFSLQYKNSYGEESAVYTRQFNFHRLP